MMRWSKPYLFLLPAAAVLFVFHLLPLGGVIWMSFFHDWGMPTASWAGLANYRAIFAADEFLRSLGITLWYAAGTIPVTIMIALIFAVLLRRKSAGTKVYRVIYFLPFVTSTVAAAAVWKWILHVDSKGLANAALAAFDAGPLRFTEESRGIFELIGETSLPVLGSGPSLALVSVMIFAVWQAFGFYVIILMSALTQIPRETYEAASLDGAGSVRQFTAITMPMLKPIIGFLVIISTLHAFQTFNQIYIMAPSERLHSARNATMYIVTQFWDYQRLGPAAAASVCLFVILLALTAVQLRLSRAKD